MKKLNFLKTPIHCFFLNYSQLTGHIKICDRNTWFELTVCRLFSRLSAYLTSLCGYLIGIQIEHIPEMECVIFSPPNLFLPLFYSCQRRGPQVYLLAKAWAQYHPTGAAFILCVGSSHSAQKGVQNTAVTWKRFAS